ncbi:alkyl hydroperoxide reductase [Brevundimonas sp. Leaf363]|uniref:peroxiredoxin n=1 Tax=Brevundimonas sp. Leaf363 TaxID=1736353 RepID=UPI0006F7334A|nr:peroxiredoxin [Brevundimonas sp. Leaf363]KQS56300.1 alkyl hydroperoxide reductase [Brevundimonas sp. Leaf363]
MVAEDGQPAPALDLPTDDGAQVSLAALNGPAVIFFYPKADTPACTSEAKDFTALAEDFAKLGVALIGVSKDAPKKLARFRAKHELGVILASDETGGVCEAWGVWGEKQLYGRTYMGIERATFLIDAQGRVRQSWRKVKTAGHAQSVLDAARAL